MNHDYYVGVSGKMLRDKNLSLEAKAIMCAIYDIASFQLSNNEEINIGTDEVVKYLGGNIDKTTYLNAIVNLYDAGYIELRVDDLVTIDVLGGKNNA